MTQMTLSMLLRAEGAAAAKAAVEGVKQSTDSLGAATTRGAAADRAAAAAKQTNAQASLKLAGANRMAAGATGNLVAQFNDIGVMLAAGQNPLQLAIQQGTQITQVIGPMGAAGAFKALGGAVVGMLNPLSLVTIGVIGFGAAAVQWFMSASEEATGLTAELERQEEAIKAIVAETEKLRLARGIMLSGAQSADEQIVLEETRRLLAERKALVDELEQSYTRMGRAAGTAGADVIRAKQQELTLEIQKRDAALAALDAQRKQNAETAETLDLAGKVRTATVGVTSALQSANGSRLQTAFASAFPLANQLLGIAQGIVATIGGLATGPVGPGMGRGASPGGPVVGSADLAALQAGGGTWRNIPAKIPGGGGGGGGGGAARDEANALQELITSLEGEIEALRVQDPIQQEMLKHREALTGATEAERQKVEELIATREREALLMEGAKARAAFFEDIGTNALDALITKGESFNDVLKNITSSLIEAVVQAAIFGSGPFGSLFGGKSILSGLFGGGGGGGGGGFLGGLFGGARAAGGMVYGPGSGTSDSVLMALSNGEMVINAKATSRNRHLLEAINAGALPGYAAGGIVGGGGADARRMSGRGGRDMPATVYIDARGSRGDREIEEIVRKGATQVVSLYDREGLAVSVQRVSRDPKRRG